MFRTKSSDSDSLEKDGSNPYGGSYGGTASLQGGMMPMSVGGHRISTESQGSDYADYAPDSALDSADFSRSSGQDSPAVRFTLDPRVYLKSFAIPLETFVETVLECQRENPDLDESIFQSAFWRTITTLSNYTSHLTATAMETDVQQIATNLYYCFKLLGLDITQVVPFQELFGQCLVKFPTILLTSKDFELEEAVLTPTRSQYITFEELEREFVNFLPLDWENVDELPAEPENENHRIGYLFGKTLLNMRLPQQNGLWTKRLFCFRNVHIF